MSQDVHQYTEQSRSERRKMGKALRQQVPRSSHGDWKPAPDRPDPISLLLEQAMFAVKLGLVGGRGHYPANIVSLERFSQAVKELYSARGYFFGNSSVKIFIALIPNASLGWINKSKRRGSKPCGVRFIIFRAYR